MPQGLRKHLVGRRVQRRREQCPSRGSAPQVPRHRHDEEASEVYEDGIKLLAAGCREESDHGADETHVEVLRVLLTTTSHELHHGDEDRRRRCILAGEAQDVAKGQADLLHQFLVLRVVDANPLDCREVSLHDCQHRVGVRSVQWVRIGWHVVDAGDGRNVELQLQRRLAIRRCLHRARAERLSRQLAEDGSQWLFHACNKDAQHLLELLPVVQHGEHLANAEDQLCAAVHIEPSICHQGDDCGDYLPPKRAPIGRHYALARGCHDHLHGVARDGLAVLLRIGVRPPWQHWNGRQMLHCEEVKDLLARLWIQGKVAGGEKDEAARSAAQQQGLETLCVVGQLRQQLNELGNDGVLPGGSTRGHARQHEDTGIDVLPGDGLARADLL
mmetsp:Transcript_2912/g.9072  ORF Transcript_2912/g.9072 Transcript_2912/m.9072 type:complete len:386 (-) Transcript_2912:1727-2884(-)